MIGSFIKGAILGPIVLFGAVMLFKLPGWLWGALGGGLVALFVAALAFAYITAENDAGGDARPDPLRGDGFVPKGPLIRNSKWVVRRERFSGWRYDSQRKSPDKPE